MLPKAFVFLSFVVENCLCWRARYCVNCYPEIRILSPRKRGRNKECGEGWTTLIGPRENCLVRYSRRSIMAMSNNQTSNRRRQIQVSITILVAVSIVVLSSCVLVDASQGFQLRIFAMGRVPLGMKTGPQSLSDLWITRHAPRCSRAWRQHCCRNNQFV